uniref:Uncharacterized protein n=1 Tax=Photinus pyralis TaxID=7054 RepID=A0A1Y1LEU1_PHOPY
MLASTKYKADDTSAAITPMQANAKDHPKKLFACPGIQPLRFANDAKTITAMPPDRPAINVTTAVAQINMTNFDMSGPQQRPYSKLRTAPISMHIKATVKKNCVVFMKAGAKYPRMSS